VLNVKSGMGYGGRSGRVGSTSRQESNEGSKEKKDKSAGVAISADEIRKLVAKFLRESSFRQREDFKKAPRLLTRLSEETIHALGFIS
jgi:hypothetical protein